MSTQRSQPVGVEAALRAASDPNFVPRPTLLEKELSLAGRVAVVTGSQRGLGLEMAEALAEAGATVYCLDLPAQPDPAFATTQKYVARLGLPKSVRLEYIAVDVSDQKAVWNVFDKIGQKEGRLDVCVANAGILREAPCLEYPAEEFQKLLSVNINGVLYTAQGAGRQMVKFGLPGSIIITASMAGSITCRGQSWIAYQTSKGGLLQMARNLACELGPKNIRVNSISPGYVNTDMTRAFLDVHKELMAEWSNENPMGRIGRPDEFRGVITWLASDSSTFCTGSDIIVDGGHRAW